MPDCTYAEGRRTFFLPHRAPARACAYWSEISLAEPDARERTPAGEVLQPRQGWLAHQVGAADEGLL
jgi:hypothetical protein